MNAVCPTEKQLRALIDGAAQGVLFVDEHGIVQFHNDAASNLFGCPSGQLRGIEVGALIPADLGIDPSELPEMPPPNRILAFMGTTLDVRAYRRDGEEFIADVTVSRIVVDDEVIYTLELRDISQRIARENERERLLLQLGQSHKLESVGRLAAGIAHEINTPVQYVGDNLQFLKESLSSLQEVLESFRATARLERGADHAAALAVSDKLAEDQDLEYLSEEMPRAIAQAIEGATHIGDIVSAMKAFCHPGRPDKEPVDLNAAIQNAISVSRNEWKYVAALDTNLDDAIPNVVCNENEIKQVLLNLIVNSAHAIGEKNQPQSEERGLITIATRPVAGFVEIEIADDGPGIPEHALSRLFDPFYTTKEVGKGTGQGLAITHSIIVDRHGGEIDVQSEPGRGASFLIRLPL